MKKALFVILTAITCLVLLCGCGDDDYEKVSFGNDSGDVSAKNDEYYKVDFKSTEGFADDFTPKSEYRVGEIVEIKLVTATENYYRVFANREQVYMDDERSDMSYSYFTFTMPAEDVVVSINSVDVTIPDASQLSGSVTVESEDSKYYLTLPISGDRLRVSEDQLAALEAVTPQMIENAERAILEQLEEYSDSKGGVYLGNDAQGYLCLQAELIVDINPPKIQIQDWEIVSSGCNIDHKHVFFSQRIE